MRSWLQLPLNTPTTTALLIAINGWLKAVPNWHSVKHERMLRVNQVFLQYLRHSFSLHDIATDSFPFPANFHRLPHCWQVWSSLVDFIHRTFDRSIQYTLHNFWVRVKPTDRENLLVIVSRPTPKHLCTERSVFDFFFQGEKTFWSNDRLNKQTKTKNKTNKTNKNKNKNKN